MRLRFFVVICFALIVALVDPPTGAAEAVDRERVPAPESLRAIVADDLIDPAAVYETDRATRFPDILHAHVDAYWADRFAEAGRPYRSPGGVVGFSQPIETGCGIADPATETAFYCVLDETIYYSDEFRSTIETNIGDYGWVVVVAHEWGHHAQQLLGDDATMLPFQSGGSPSLAIEQQADCLAGAYTEAAEFSGWLETGDVGEAIATTGLSGDPHGTTIFDPAAHGSGAQRVAAFGEGYERGLSVCGLSL